MKQLAPLFLSALILASCGDGAGTDRADGSTGMVVPATVMPASAGSTTGARILARGHLRVGVRYDLEPFGSVTTGGELVGFDIDLGREFARRWLGDARAVEFLQVRSDTAVERLQEGAVDIVLGALTHTRDREAGADFTLPYFRDGQALLVRASDPAPIQGPQDVAGRTVGVVAWADAYDVLQAAVPFTLTVRSYDRFDEAVAGLGRGEVDAVAEMRRRLFWGTRMLPGSAVVGQYTVEPAAIAFPQNDAFFANLVHLTLQDLLADGTFARLYSHWFAPEEMPDIERWPGNGPTPQLASGPSVARVPDTIAAIEARGRVNVALVADRPPFAYVDVNGALAGYEVELVRSMLVYWLADASAIDFIAVSADMGKEMLFTGQADMLVGAVAHTRDAELEMDLSETTYIAGQGLIVQVGGPIVGVESLQGQLVAVVDGSGSGDVVQSVAQDAGVSVAVASQPTLEAAIAMLVESQVAAVVADRSTLLRPAYASQNLQVLPLRLTQVPFALGLPAGDSAFRDLVNLTLQAMATRGELDAIYRAWFADPPPQVPRWPGAPYRDLRLAVAVSPAGG